MGRSVKQTEGVDTMIIEDATAASVPAITAIYNDAVLHTTAIWNESPVDEADRSAWLTDRQRRGYPVVVAVGSNSSVLGYATFGEWRAITGFRATVEHSVYVRADQRGKGIGRALMNELIDRARAMNLHVLVAGVDAQNDASIALHERLGFTRTAYMPHVGAKFGRWLDLVFLQLILDDRSTPEGAFEA